MTKAISRKDVCYFCGAASDSYEHVPPKGLFPKGQRRDLVTVGSCAKHNTDKSGHDEYFRLVLAGQVWPTLPEGIKEKLERSWQRRPALGWQVINASFRKANGDGEYDVDDRFFYSLEAVGRGLLFHADGVVRNKLEALIVTDFTKFATNDLELMIHERTLKQARRDTLKDQPYLGKNPTIFKYRTSEKFVEFVIYQSLITTIQFVGLRA